jgi:hypothetical protein
MGLFSDHGGEIVTFAKNGDVKVHARSVDEAKLALKQLKLRKKELGVLKREITSREQSIRAEYADHVRRQGSKLRGGGGIGRFVRNVQTAQRDSARKDLAKKLGPLDKDKHRLDMMIATVDKVILQVELQLMKKP